MFAIQTKTSFFSFLPTFLLALAVSINFYLFLHFKLHPLDDHHLMAGLSTAILTLLLFAPLVSRTRQQGRYPDTELGPDSTVQPPYPPVSKKSNNKPAYNGAALPDTDNHKKIEQFEFQDDWEETFNTITDFISVHDKDFRITRANKSLCEFLGKPREEIIGKRCYQLFHNTNEPFAGCPHVKAMDTGHSVSAEINDPNIGFPLQITCSPFFDEKDVLKGSVHLARTVGDPCEPSSETKKTNLVAVCASCKNIRDSKGIWRKIEEYIPRHHGSRCTHSICLECQQKLYPRFTR